MKVLLVTSRFPFGPKEAFLTEEVARLSEEFDVLIMPALPTRQKLAVPALRYRALRMRLMSRAVLLSALREFAWRPLRALRVLSSVVAEPRSLNAKLKNIVIFPTALAAARLARTNGVQHVHAYWLTTPATIAFVVSELCGIEWSASGHRYDLVDFNITSGSRPRAGFVRTARFVRTISRQGADRVEQALQGSRAPAVRVIHLGVAIPQERVAVNDRDVLHLLCAANLEPVKGHDTLFEALELAAQRCDVRCTILGDGTLREELERRAALLRGRVTVVLEGAVPHERLLARMASGEFNGAILTSVDEGPAQREGIPVFLMEAMARGLPVIATRSGAIGELCDSRNALLAPPADAPAIADAIVALAGDPELRNRLSIAGRARVLAEFDASRTARSLGAMIRGDRQPFALVPTESELSA